MPRGDNTASPAFRLPCPRETIVAVVGGVNIPVDYAGRAGYAGEDQINFTLPSNIPTGCAVSSADFGERQAQRAHVYRHRTRCQFERLRHARFHHAQLQKLDQGGTITTGGFSITQFSITASGRLPRSLIPSAEVSASSTGSNWRPPRQANVSVIQSGSCQVIQSTSGSGSTASTGSLTYLDAGTVTVNGPAGSSLTNQALTKTNNIYSYSNTEGLAIPGQTSFTLPAGSYTLNGAGGNDVGIVQHLDHPRFSAHRYGRLAQLGHAQRGTDSQLDRRQCLRSGGDHRLFLNYLRQRAAAPSPARPPSSVSQRPDRRRSPCPLRFSTSCRPPRVATRVSSKWPPATSPPRLRHP